MDLDAEFKEFVKENLGRFLPISKASNALYSGRQSGEVMHLSSLFSFYRNGIREITVVGEIVVSDGRSTLYSTSAERIWLSSAVPVKAVSISSDRTGF
ncbi:MAG: hypothetical protein R3B54_14240 [Bdellovibrionota bacterium]